MDSIVYIEDLLKKGERTERNPLVLPISLICDFILVVDNIWGKCLLFLMIDLMKLL